MSIVSLYTACTIVSFSLNSVLSAAGCCFAFSITLALHTTPSLLDTLTFEYNYSVAPFASVGAYLFCHVNCLTLILDSFFQYRIFLKFCGCCN